MTAAGIQMSNRNRETSLVFLALMLSLKQESATHNRTGEYSNYLQLKESSYFRSEHQVEAFVKKASIEGRLATKKKSNMPTIVEMMSMTITIQVRVRKS